MINIEPSYEETQSFTAEVNGVILFFQRMELDLKYYEDNISIWEKKEIFEIFQLPESNKYILYKNTVKLVHPIRVNLVASSLTSSQAAISTDRNVSPPVLVGFVATLSESDYVALKMGDLI